jgi:hypothetical protein
MSCLTEQVSWPSAAETELAVLRNPDGGWAHRAGDASATEPTALAVLALAGLPWFDASASLGWLLSRQDEDGFFSASAVHLERSWVTPLAAMACRRAGHVVAAERAADALLGEQVFTLDAALARGIYGYDTATPGWPWTSGGFSFIEPTALAMIFLKQAGRGAERRVAQGAKMLRGRAIATGGWNYGESQVLGGDLFATAAPSALALAALADEQDAVTAGALTWLRSQQGSMSSLFSLGWSACALNVLGYLDDAWRQGVMNRWCEAPAHRRGPQETALCLLALRGGPSHPLAVL